MDQLGPYTIIIAGSIIVLLSFLCGLISKKTNIPSVLMLIALGVGVQYFMRYQGINDVNFFPVLEVLGIIGLIMIVLEAALELELKRDKFWVILKSLVVALVGLVGSTAAAGVIIYYLVPGMGWLQAMLYATPLSILSSAIIIPSVDALSTEKREFHIYESTFSDILGIMLFYLLIGLIDSHSPIEAAGHVAGDPIADFFVSLALTVGVALVASYILLISFQHITGDAKLFLLISMLLLLYSVGKLMHLSPLIIILVFGLLVSNSILFFRGPLKRLLHIQKFDEMVHGLHVVTKETAFIARTFFFVIFGASIMLSSLLSIHVLFVSTLLLASVYGVRWIFLRIFVGSDLQPQLWIAPRGLITVLLFYAIPEPHVNGSFDPGIMLFVIIATGLVMTVGMIVASRKRDTPIQSTQDSEFTFENVPLPEVEKEE